MLAPAQKILIHRSIGAGLLAIALLSMLGWITFETQLASWGRDFVPMAPNTALLFAAWGGLLLSSRLRTPAWPASLGALSACIGLARLAELLLARDYGVDRLVFKAQEATLGIIPLAQMAGPTAAAFVVLGGAGLGLASERRWPWGRNLVGALACLAAAEGLSFLLSYLQGAPLMYGGSTIPMALSTAFCFTALGSALALEAGWEAWPLRLLAGDSPKARLRRVLLPLALGAVLATHLATLALPSGRIHPGLVLLLVSAVFALVTAVLGERLAGWVLGQSESMRQAWAEERERLRVTLRSIGDGVITTDLEGSVALMNKAAERLSGWSQEEARGRPASQIFRAVDEDSRGPIPDPVAQVIDQDTPSGAAQPVLLLRRDGSEITVGHNVAPIHDDQSRLVGAVLVFRDLSLSRHLDRELVRREKIESLAMLAGGLAHDFNNILSIIMGNLSLARFDAGDPAKVKAKLGEAEAAAKRATGLTRQLMAFSKGGDMARNPLHLPELVYETAAFALSGALTVFEIEGDRSEQVWNVNADAGQIAQVIQNLVLNAHQAMGKEGKVTLTLKNCSVGLEQGLPLPPGPYVRLSVRDQGPGIPPEIHSRIFDPFFTTKSQGTGLGLASVYSILQRHGGHVAVESRPGEGAAFHVYLPAAGELYTPAGASRKGDQGGAARGRVLVMDDDPGVRNIALAMLGRMGYEATAAAEGEEALALQRVALNEGRPYGVVLLDLTVPGGMGGVECLDRLRSAQPGLAAVVSSGYTAGAEMANYQAHGFHAALVKPYTYEELSRLLEKLLSARRT